LPPLSNITLNNNRSSHNNPDTIIIMECITLPLSIFPPPNDKSSMVPVRIITMDSNVIRVHLLSHSFNLHLLPKTPCTARTRVIKALTKYLLAETAEEVWAAAVVL
jgi:hypothetical protein